jgi:hypothetical protein
VQVQAARDAASKRAAQSDAAAQFDAVRLFVCALCLPPSLLEQQELLVLLAHFVLRVSVRRVRALT